MTTYPYPATAYYPEYVAQPTYQIQPHPYGGNYTTTAHLQPELYERPSSRRTVSPASSNDRSDSSRSHHHRRRSSIYLDPETGHIVVTGGSPSRRDRDREQRSREREQQREREAQRQYELEKEERRLRREKERREAAAAAAVPTRSEMKTKPIPFSRSSTMPTGHTIAPPYETRGRRPIIMSERYDGDAVSARIPIGPVPIVEHASRGRSGGSRRYSTSRTYDYPPASPGYTTSSGRPITPPGYTSNDEELHRRASYRARAHDEVRTSRGGREFSASAPERGGGGGGGHHEAMYDSYGSSYGSSASGFTPPPSRGSGGGGGHRRMSSSGSREPVVKNLRWADLETRKGIQDQNDRINQRPKFGRPRSGSTSILKQRE